jgi:hypothetical protein
LADFGVVNLTISKHKRNLAIDRIQRLIKTLIAADLGFDQLGAATFIHATRGKNVLGEIYSDGDNADDFPLLWVLMKSTNSIMALLMPFATTSPQPRDGEVPFIR